MDIVSRNDMHALTGNFEQIGSIVGSDFLLHGDDWNIVGNKEIQASVTFESFSRGPLLNRYIYGSDNKINNAGSSYNDKSLWYFNAPSKYLGNKGNGLTDNIYRACIHNLYIL
jgi:hypothetical protein